MRRRRRRGGSGRRAAVRTFFCSVSVAAPGSPGASTHAFPGGESSVLLVGFGRPFEPQTLIDFSSYFACADIRILSNRGKALLAVSSRRYESSTSVRVPATRPSAAVSTRHRLTVSASGYPWQRLASRRPAVLVIRRSAPLGELPASSSAPSRSARDNFVPPPNSAELACQECGKDRVLVRFVSSDCTCQRTVFRSRLLIFFLERSVLHDIRLVASFEF